MKNLEARRVFPLSLFMLAAVVIISEICFFATCTHADEPSALSLQGLSDSERNDILKSLLESRRDLTSNIQIQSETHIFNTKYENGKPLGGAVNDSGWYMFDLFFRDGSYRIQSSWFKSQEQLLADMNTESNYLVDDGFGRIIAKPGGEARGTYGRIADFHDGSIRNNRAVYLLSPTSHVPDNHFLIDSVLSMFDAWEVRVFDDRQVVSIEVPYSILGRNENMPIGSRTVQFDYSRGMVPVESTLSWKDNRGWREEYSRMSKIEIYDSLWFPMRIEEIVRASALGPDLCSQYLTNVKLIRIGSVRESDLAVDFPTGTEVVDDIRGVSYVEGSSSKPQPLGVVSVSPKNLAARPPLGRNGLHWVLVINIVVVSAFVVCLVFYWTRKRFNL